MTSLKTILKNFLNHVDKLESQKKLGQDPFEEEFQKLKDLTEQLKHDPNYSCSQGECDVNRRKNRYKDILPYNYTRVVLSEYPGVPGSDYINANYIKGGSGSLAYIASQGPLPNTMVDFWRMIWECEVQVVVMACKEQESGKYKCECYWPEEGEQRQYGNITVELVKWRQVCPDFLVRTLKACWEDETRTICQFHYATWPDHGVPTSVQPILELVRLVRDCQASEALPVLVHCSAGCGRTGTICAIDYVWGLMRMGKLTKSFSLYEIAAEMRRQRVAMVQTKEQYYLVHRAVTAMFEQQLRVIDSHTYENVDEDGEPLVWKELRDKNDSIYEDVYESCLKDETKADKRKYQELDLEKNQLENCQQNNPVKYLSQELRNEDKEKSQMNHPVAGNTQKFWNQLENNTNVPQISIEEQCQDSEDESGQLSRRNSQILLKLKREESVKRLISGWNKVTENSDVKTLASKQSDNKSKNNIMQSSNITLANKDDSLALNQSLKHNNDEREQQESSSRVVVKERKLSVNDPSFQEINNGTANSDEKVSTILDSNSYERKSFRNTIGEEKHLHGKLIGKATVIRRPSIAKLKALFEKSLSIESDSSLGLPSHQRRHPLFRSHSHHLSRDFRPQQERETVLSMVARKLLRSPLREMQHGNRQNDSKSSYSDAQMSAAAEIECLTLLCAQERNVPQIQELNKATKTLNFETTDDKLIFENLSRKQSVSLNEPQNTTQSEYAEKQIDSGNTTETVQIQDDITEPKTKNKEISVETEQYSACRRKLSSSNEKENALVENTSNSNYLFKPSIVKNSMVPLISNPPELPTKKKPLQPFGVLNHKAINWTSNEKEEISEKCFSDKTDHSVSKDKSELLFDGSGDYVVLRTRDPAIDVAFSRRRSQEEGIYGTIKHHSVSKDPKCEEFVPYYAKPVTVPITQVTQSGQISLIKSNDLQRQYLVSELQSEIPNQMQHVGDIKNKCTENFYDEHECNKTSKCCTEQREIFKYDKSNQINKLSSAKIINSVKDTETVMHNSSNVQYTNINVTTKKNIAQIENVLNHHPRGAILDLTSRKSYILNDPLTFGDNIGNTSSNAMFILRNTTEKSCLPITSNFNSKLKYEKLWSSQNNSSETVTRTDSENKDKIRSCINNPLNDLHLAQECDKHIYETQHYKLNHESGNSRNLLLHSPTPKSKRLHLPRTSNKSKSQSYNIYESPQIIKKCEKDVYKCDQISTETNDLKVLQNSQLNHKSNSSTFNVISENFQKEGKNELTETVISKDCYNNKQCQRKDYKISSENNRGIYQKYTEGNNLEHSIQNQTVDLPNHISTHFNKVHNSPTNNTFHSPKHHSYESIYGHLEQFVKRKQQKLDSDYEYVYPINNSKSKDSKYEDVIAVNNSEETSVKKPVSSPSRSNVKWMTVCENIPGSENWKLMKTHSSQNDNIQNYAVGPPKPPRTFSQLLPGQKDNLQQSSNLKQAISSNDGGRLLVPVASPKSITKQYYSQVQNNRNEIKPSTCFHKDSQNINVVSSKSSSNSISWLPQDATYTTNIHTDTTTVSKNSCAIYSLPSTLHQHQANNCSSNVTNRNPPNSPYHKLKNVPIYATVREHFPLRYQSEKQPQILKNANTYENIYDAQKVYYGINPVHTDNYMGRSSQQISMHGLRHSQSDASVYVALRSMRPMSNDLSDIRPQPPSYNEAVRPRRIGEPLNVNRNILDIPYGMEQRRCRDDMDIRPAAVSRLKQEAHARRSMVEWDVGMTVAPDTQDNSDMAEYSQVIRKPGIKKMNTRSEKMPKDDLPPSVPQKTRGAYEMPDTNQTKENREKSSRDGNTHTGFGGTISKAFGKLTLFTKFGSRNEQNNPQVSGAINKDLQGKKTNENTKVFSFPHRLPRKPRGSKHPPKQWTQV